MQVDDSRVTHGFVPCSFDKSHQNIFTPMQRVSTQQPELMINSQRRKLISPLPKILLRPRRFKN